MTKIFEPSELIINPDNSVFHLHLKPNEIADDIILVGDPQRVNLIASFFQKQIYNASNREFYAITGLFNDKLITVVSTGIGTDNIDIVINELDALANIDFSTRQTKKQKRKLRFIRIGTSGAIQPDIKPGSIVASQFVIGFDGLLNFYKNRNQVCDTALEESFIKQSSWPEVFPAPYCLQADQSLMKSAGNDYVKGITLSANGFYGPQGRELRAELAYPDFFNKLPDVNYNNFRITNFEMECSALYGLSKILGHKALTVCLIIANRSVKTFIGDYSKKMKDLIHDILNSISNG